jgi:hypothetical protein
MALGRRPTMADEQRGKNRGGEVFDQGRRIEVEDRLGQLHEARNVTTGTPALTLVPGEDVAWQPEGPCRMSLTYAPGRESVTVDVEQAPASVRTSELTNLLVLMTAVFRRIEDDAEVEARLASGPVRPSESSAVWGRWDGSLRKGLAVAGVAMLAMTLGAWLVWLSPRTLESLQKDDTPGEPPFFADGQDLSLAAIAYPMPEVPYKEQRKPPCLEGTETEIRGGCWIQHKRDAPCPRNTAEYEGKCFIPVKKPEPVPQSVEP